jgi:HNH endonuclease
MVRTPTIPSNRPDIPASLARAVLVETGHRCAIPTCRQTPVELAHIVAWEKAREHTFDNLIALCPTCHTRYDRKEIDRQSMLQYKANLSVLNGRYGELEQRVMRLFASAPEVDHIQLPGGYDLLLLYLLQDGLLIDVPQQTGMWLLGQPLQKMYRLTPKGRSFIDRWLNAEQLP